MVNKEMASVIISALKKDGVFIPTDNSFNEILNEMESIGYVNVSWNKFPSEHPYSVVATKLFEDSARLGKI